MLLLAVLCLLLYSVVARMQGCASVFRWSNCNNCCLCAGYARQSSRTFCAVPCLTVSSASLPCCMLSGLDITLHLYATSNLSIRNQSPARLKCNMPFALLCMHARYPEDVGKFKPPISSADKQTGMPLMHNGQKLAHPLLSLPQVSKSRVSSVFTGRLQVN